MSTIKEKVIIITGASSGIGEATARLLAQEGAHVVLGARRTDNLKAIANDIIREGGSADYRRLDVTNKEEMNEFVTYVNSRYGQVDVLINNAGVMPLSKLAALKTDEWNQMVDVNIRGVLHGIAAGLPIMNKQKFGHFINVSSIGAHEVSPTAAVYCATKFAVRALSEGLRMETGPNIRVTNIAPGVTESELAESISDEEAKQVMKEYRRISLPSNAIAQSILYAIKQPENVDVNEIIVRPTA
ncbi:SDR family oxidoreductase [Shouchella miscanthi]|uniref:SDR family oxidoreductase n=1 Tax=Shouchella miscanthi TaxID=2598861 RepID=A0ABU6NQL4_9BACI|nr:SDR family oxidoreductase [Shouchella miscanthi]MED4129698.1 SDR family oxidoreductase [Shouchella miscanthi]RQW22898.1 SDR family oxidoreductase [Bacillus sp. C1-1]